MILAVLLLDSLVSYFLRNLAGVNPPVNAAVPVIMLVAILVWGIKPAVPPVYALGWLLLLGLAFLFGILLIEGESPGRVLTLASAATAFFVGYAFARNTQSEDLLGRVLLTVSLIYVVVCVLAVAKVAPGLLPVVNAYGYRSGELVIRPEVTIDQNFQIFYLFFIAVLCVLPVKLLRFALVFLGSIGALYVLAQLHTRSGVLVFIGTMTLAWLAPLLVRDLGKARILVLPLLLLGFAVVQFDWILQAAEGVVTRFTDPQYTNTVYGRIYAAMFLVEKLADPVFWMPQGNAPFGPGAESIPHFNPTAVYLEAGLLGLVAWVMLVPVPLARLAILFLRNRLDALETMVLIAGSAVFFAQLSLNTPLYDQAWLWMGAVIGALERARRRVGKTAHVPQGRRSSASVPATRPRAQAT